MKQHNNSNERQKKESRKAKEEQNLSNIDERKQNNTAIKTKKINKVRTVLIIRFHKAHHITFISISFRLTSPN